MAGKPISALSDVGRRLQPNGIEEFEGPGTLVRLNNNDFPLEMMPQKGGLVVIDSATAALPAQLKAMRSAVYQLVRKWHPANAVYKVVNQDRDDPYGDTHTSGGGRRSFVWPAILDPSAAHAFSRAWSKSAIEKRPLAHSMATKMSGSRRIWVDGWTTDRKTVDGYNSLDREHLELNPFAGGVFAGALLESCSRLPEIALHLHLRALYRLYPAKERGWHSGASRAIGWRLLAGVLGHLCGLNDVEQLGVTPRQDLIECATQLAVDNYSDWGVQSAGKAMPGVPDPSDYGWHEGILLFGAAVLLASEILPAALASEFMDWATRRARYLLLNIVDERGVSRSFSSWGNYDQLDLARWQSIYDKNSATDQIKLELTADGVIREAPRKADSELLAAGLAYFLPHSVGVNSILALHPKLNSSAYDVEQRYLNPALAWSA